MTLRLSTPWVSNSHTLTYLSEASRILCGHRSMIGCVGSWCHGCICNNGIIARKSKWYPLNEINCGWMKNTAVGRLSFWQMTLLLLSVIMILSFWIIDGALIKSGEVERTDKSSSEATTDILWGYNTYWQGCWTEADALRDLMYVGVRSRAIVVCHLDLSDGITLADICIPIGPTASSRTILIKMDKIYWHNEMLNYKVRRYWLNWNGWDPFRLSRGLRKLKGKSNFLRRFKIV